MRIPTFTNAAILGSLFALVATLPAQALRRGIADADTVVVARQVGKTKHSDSVVLHRLQVLREIRDADGYAAVTVIDWPKISLHQRPSPRQSRLYCLKDATTTANRLGLPTAKGPYFKMVGWQGSNPLIGAKIEEDPIVGFADLLARGRDGASAVETAAELATVAVRGAPPVRTEATRLLSERADLRGRITGQQWSQVIARASGETDDIDYKIALAELCAEQRLAGLVDTLAISLGPVQDPEYARAVGRIARLIHGEEGTGILERRLQHLRNPEDRAVVLQAIGATNTDTALAFLLQLDSVVGADTAIVTALKEHRSPRAREAVLRRRKE